MSKFFKQFFAVLVTLRNKRDHVILVKQNFTVTDPIEVDLSYKVVRLFLDQKMNAKLHLWQEFYKPQLPVVSVHFGSPHSYLVVTYFQ